MQELKLVVILLLSIATSLDNFGISITYGIRKINIPLIPNIIIAAMNGAGNLAAMMFGNAISGIVNPDLSKYLGALLVMCIGIWVIIQEIIARHCHVKESNQFSVTPGEWCRKSMTDKVAMICKNPVAADADCSGSIDISESLFLGLALTLSNIAGGVGAGMMGYSPFLTTTMVVIFSILAVLVGIRIGRYWLARLLGDMAGLIAGVFLLFISIYELVS